MRNLIYILFLIFIELSAQQLLITRIEDMPDKPAPYLMRDWKKAALGYDSLVFNFNATGKYLPLIRINSNTVNYPGTSSFGLHTYVGSNSPLSAEAINCIPAVIGASLVGIDKRNQDGQNFVLMSREWFNKNNGVNVYKNHPVDASYNDFWYETMPNVFFYQLYDLYRETEDFSEQFNAVANRWLESVKAMGGNSAPWNLPNINLRGWDLLGMKPNNSGVPEPEAAGAIAWILYNAYKETGKAEYRIGAEWCLEFLNNLDENPAYELQLSYGAYIAAKMNAELGTNYDVPKIFAWCFNTAELRNWGAIVGKWGGYDVSGLIGEVNNNNDYAFSMNTFEQIGALVPLVRYDDRFARAVGKWVLNAANSSRLFYTNFLPDGKQDGEDWAHQYDPNSYIAHEAIRQEKYGFSPYATGDAVDNGWAETNLSLYSSSHIGLLGAIIDTTDIPMILKLDLLKTDFFGDKAYPTYLLFNPYAEDKTVTLDIGSGSFDLYDAVSNHFLRYNVSGRTDVRIKTTIPIVLVVVPSGGEIKYLYEKTIVNGIVIDYNNGRLISNHPPRIKALSATATEVMQNSSIKIYCSAEDREGDSSDYFWSATAGALSGTGSAVEWKSPDTTGTAIIRCIVEDPEGLRDTAELSIKIIEFKNNPPIIEKIKAHPRKIDLSSTSRLSCSAYDSDGDSLIYSWSARTGTISEMSDSAEWTAPAVEGNYFIKCSVTDVHGAAAEDSVEISVRDFNNSQTGNLILYLPFNGNATDESGNNNHVSVSGANLTQDRFGSDGNAYNFDGINDVIQVKNNNLLNFQNSITVAFWMKIGAFFEREAYPISHGNWEHRWKISITDRKLRWTVNTVDGIKDLDSESELSLNKFYFVTCLYNGSDFEIYLDGKLDAIGKFSGKINTTSFDLTIGQVLPNNNQYNFNGVLDEIRLYDYALSYIEIQNLFDSQVGVKLGEKSRPISSIKLYQNYPNPFNPETIIQYEIPAGETENFPSQQRLYVELKIFDALGKQVATLVNKEQSPGIYQVKFDGSNFSDGIYFYRLSANSKTITKKLILLK